MIFEKLPYVPLAQEIINSSLSKSKKVTQKKIRRANKLTRKKISSIKKLDAVSSYITSILSSIYNSYSTLLEIDDFHRELIDVLIDLKEMEKHLIRINKARKVIKYILKLYTKEIKTSKSEKDVSLKFKQGLARIISVVRRTEKTIVYFRNSKMKLSRLPSIDVGIPTAVIAGPPNVGKSSLVNAISSAKSEVATYPFTTKRILVGHVSHNEIKIQVIDTPGLLDRPLFQRNKAELQAILALKHLAKLIVFVFDPSYGSYYTPEEQLRILKEIKSSFNTPMLYVINKIDIASPDKLEKIKNELNALDITYIETSITNGKNIEELKNKIVHYLINLSRQLRNSEVKV
ncbi:MAG: GTPase [Thermoproteota archaeon]|nr:50S ribosome-binding GTPase [Candidatus Brockarchaeota archaeon]